MGEKGPEFFQEVVGKATGACTEFEDVNGVVWIKGLLPVPQETEGDFGVGVGDAGVAGDVVGNGVVVPGVDALLAEELALKLPEEGLGEGLLPF